jgi:metal-responsive CopG/Arc/MetJ family transcriptional regulator
MFGDKAKVVLDKDLLRRIERHAKAAGYSSAEEFITHAVEKQLLAFEDAESEEEIRNRLRGLGYIS